MKNVSRYVTVVNGNTYDYTFYVGADAREVKAALAAIYGRTVSLARVRTMLRDNPIVEGMSSEEATVAINAHLEDDAR